MPRIFGLSIASLSTPCLSVHARLQIHFSRMPILERLRVSSPHCINFKPTVDRALETLNGTHANDKSRPFQLIYVSSDENYHEYLSYTAEMISPRWYCLPYEEHGGRMRKKKLSARFKVNGIPTIVLLRRDSRLPLRNGQHPFTLVPGGLQGRAMVCLATMNMAKPNACIDHLHKAEHRAPLLPFVCTLLLCFWRIRS